MAGHPTGLDNKLEDFERKVFLEQQQHSGEAKVVRLVGLGGVGKKMLPTSFSNLNILKDLNLHRLQRLGFFWQQVSDYQHA